MSHLVGHDETELVLNRVHTTPRATSPRRGSLPVEQRRPAAGPGSGSPRIGADDCSTGRRDASGCRRGNVCNSGSGSPGVCSRTAAAIFLPTPYSVRIALSSSPATDSPDPFGLAILHAGQTPHLVEAALGHILCPHRSVACRSREPPTDQDRQPRNRRLRNVSGTGGTVDLPTTNSGLTQTIARWQAPCPSPSR